MTIMTTKILSGWCWQSTIRHFLPPPRLFPVTSRHLAHPQFVLDNHQHRGFLNIWERVRRRIQPFQFRPIVTFSWKSLNFSTQPTVKWASIEKLKNIKSNIVFLQCPNISLCSCQDFPEECVECGGDPDPYQFYFSADPIDIFYDNSHPSYKTCFKRTGKEECCVYFKPTSVTLSNDKSLLQARQARQDQGRQRCPAGIAQVSSDAFSEFVRSSAAIVKEWAIGHWISQQLSFLCRSSIPIVQPNRTFKNHFNW